MSIHTNLKRWREARVLSYSMLAERSKVARATIVNIEKKKHIPNPETIHKLAKGLNVSVEELVKESPDDTPSNVA